MDLVQVTVSLRQKFLSLLTKDHLRFWIMFACMVTALACFGEIVDEVFDDGPNGDTEASDFDQTISKLFAGFRSPQLNQVMTDLTALGSVSVIVTLFVIFVSVLSSFGDYKGVAFITTTLMGAGLWPPLLKLYFSRVRPVDTEWLVNATSSSFPSGHSFGASAAYIGFAYYASQYAKNWPHEMFFYFLGAILALLVGISRIYLGAHYPTDVLAGISGGVAWGLLVSASYELLVRTKRKL